MATFAISAVTRKAQATANGSTTEFSFSFSVNTEADVAVFVGTTLKTISTHYTVSITASTGAGSITFTSGNTPTNGQIVTIMSKTALARSSVYTSGGTINATSLETDFDTNMMLFQQQDERLDRVITAPVDDATSIDMTLPNKDARKGLVLGFDSSTGNPTAIGQLTGAAVNVSTVSVGGSATASVAVSGGTATFALGIPTGATGATGPAGGGLAEVSSDSSPQLGGPLDVVTHDIVTTSNRDIELAPHGTGKTVLKGNTNPGTIVLNCESNSHGQTIIAQPHSASVTNVLTLPAGADATLVSTAGAAFTGAVTVSSAAVKVAGKESIWIPAAAMYPSTTNPCSDLTQVETTALRPDLKVLDFAAAADDFAQFSIAFPKSYNLGTITYQPFWTVTGTDTGTVVWQLGGVAITNDESINTAFGTLVATAAKAHSGTSNDLMVSNESGAVTIAGSPADDDQCFFQINLDTSASGQTGVVRLLGVKLFFTTDAANDA